MSVATEQGSQGFQAPPPPPMPESKPPAPRPKILLPVGIGFFVLGFLVVLGGILKFIPGGAFTGGLLCLFGILLVAFSFIPLPVVPEPEAPLSFPEKLLGIFYAPGRVFRNLRSHPHWIGAFVIVSLLSVVYWYAFAHRITPERLVDHQVEKVGEMGAWAPPANVLEQMRVDQLAELKNPVQQVETAIRQFVGYFVLGTLVAGLSLLGMLAFGGRINFWQSLAVSFWASLPIIVIQKLLGLGVLYLKSPDDLHPTLNAQTTVQDNLGILMSPSEHPLLFVWLSFIGITTIYSIWLRARGLHLGATKASSGAGWGVSIVLMVLLFILATISTALFPQFIA